jgi:DNA-binding transcriptional MocR family regulator
MNMPAKFQFSNRISGLHSSPIREILEVIDRPGMISFAGGLPAAETFPEFNTVVPRRYLQYGPSEGEQELRECVSHSLQERELDCTVEQVFILSGSQQGIDLVGKLFVDPGTSVYVESPTYLAALQVFRFYGAKFMELDQNLIADTTAFAYINPTFQNPTGYCYSRQQRADLAASCDRTSTPLFEDDPYRDLAYDSVCRTPVCAMLEQAPWIYQGSFSKSLAPGLRLGYLACCRELVPYFTRLKQAADLHSNRLSQFLVLQSLLAPDHHDRLERIAAQYKQKRDGFCVALSEHFSDLALWQVPAGGLFFWLELKDQYHCDTRELLPTAIDHGVAFMPGEAFFASEVERPAYLRLNFSHATPEQANEGLKRLSDLIRSKASG